MIGRTAAAAAVVLALLLGAIGAGGGSRPTVAAQDATPHAAGARLVDIGGRSLLLECRAKGARR